MKIVFVARFYPPIISGAGRRCRGLVEGLRRAGANVTVVAPVIIGDENGIAVPHPMPQPPHGGGSSASSSAWAGLKNAVRRHVRIPDPDIVWSKLAARATLSSLPTPPDWVFTSTPPESLLLTGLILKRATGAHWACDFRDQWLVTPHLETRENAFRQTIERRWARKFRGEVSAAFGVNASISEEFSTLLDIDVDRLPHFTLPFDGMPYAFPDETFDLVHTGRFSLSDPNCDITPLLDAFGHARRHCPKLRLHLVGALSPDEISAVGAHPHAPAITVHGLVPMETAMAMQTGADALALVIAPDAIAPPSKLVEYQAARKPILVVGDCPWSRSHWRGEVGDPASTLLEIVNGNVEPAASEVFDFEAAGRQVFETLRRLRP